jgi:hypothetical protein
MTRLTPKELQALGSFLEAVSGMSRESQVRFCAHSRSTVEVGDGVYIDVAWDQQAEQYVIDDD